METTLEVRWFIKGKPSAVVQSWFRFDAPGKLLGELETRTDLYVYIKSDLLDKFARFSSRQLNSEEVNFKSRQGNIELKLRQQTFGINGFNHLKQIPPCEGRIEINN